MCVGGEWEPSGKESVRKSGGPQVFLFFFFFHLL